MQVVIGAKEIFIIIVIVGLVSGVYLLNQITPKVGKGQNTVIISGSTQNTVRLGACTGALGESKQNLLRIQSDNFQHPVDGTLQQLDSLTISCNGAADILQLPDNFTNLGGQCCGALMNLTEYNEHLEGLKQFSYIPDIPQNPYNVSVEYAKKVIKYDLDTVLNSQQQTTLDSAAKLSDEGGPCCCKCWHWYFNEGIAKKLIKDYNFTAKQVAEFYDLSDTCGT